MPDQLHQLAAIFSGVILPILVMIGLGALLQRFSAMHMPTLTRLNIYLLVPAFLFLNVYESDLAWRQIGGIMLAVVIPMAIIGVPLFVAMRTRGIAAGTMATVVLGSVVFNAGNFGIPVALLHYGEKGVATQALIVLVSNLSIWYLGYVILALGAGRGWRGGLGYFKLPMIYVIVLAFVLREYRFSHPGFSLPSWVSQSVGPLGAAVVPIGLVTLGAQLVVRARWPRWRLVSTVMVVKLLFFPAVAGLAVWWLGLWPWPGKQIIVASAAPTAVNTLLLTIELEGDADTAADCVFWTTVASVGSVAAAIWIVDMLAPGVP
jgi:predicted permease